MSVVSSQLDLRPTEAMTLLSDLSSSSSVYPLIFLQHVLCVLLCLAIMVFIKHLIFTRADAGISKLVFLLLLSRTQ